MSSPFVRIGIIGGGFSGAMTAVHLLRSGSKRFRIHLFEPSGQPGTGIAYSTYSERHLLNVQAGNMSAFPDDAGGFVRWLSKQPEYTALSTEELSTSYVPRMAYGRYLRDAFNSAANSQPEALEIVPHHVTGYHQADGAHTLTTTDGTEYTVDILLLATGNFIPGKPKGIPLTFTESPLYFGNPWSQEAVTGYTDSLPVLITGTGLTMVDTVLGLREAGYQGNILALSPKGFRILSHRSYVPQPQILTSLHPPYRLDELFRLFRQHIREVRARGISGEAVVDAVRSKTREIWSSLQPEEKQRFVSHLRHLWGLARHRLPASVHSSIQKEIELNSLTIVSGRILDVHHEGSAALITYYDRHLQQVRDLKAGRLINCTGPQTDITRLNDPLYRQLLESGVITADPLGMGVRCDEKGRPFSRKGEAEPSLIVLGSLLKGDRWESTAVPELRVQAREAAEYILQLTDRP